jgi:hypothetical protein
MNVKNNSSINDNALVDWIDNQWKSARASYRKAKEDEEKNKILLSMAKVCRQYINSVRNKRAGVQPQYKHQAHEMIEFLQKELLKLGWSPQNNIILLAIQYGRKHTGNIAIEGRALQRPVTAADRKRREQLERKAQKRLAVSLANVIAQDADNPSDLNGSDLQLDRP